MIFYQGLNSAVSWIYSMHLIIIIQRFKIYQVMRGGYPAHLGMGNQCGVERVLKTKNRPGGKTRKRTENLDLYRGAFDFYNTFFKDKGSAFRGKQRVVRFSLLSLRGRVYHFNTIQSLPFVIFNLETNRVAAN